MFGIESTEETSDCKSENGCPSVYQQRSQSISSSFDNNGDDDDHNKYKYGSDSDGDNYGKYQKEKIHKKLKKAKRIDPKPEITKSAFYISPKDIERESSYHHQRRYRRGDKKEDYEQSYRDFISEHFPSKLVRADGKKSNYKTAGDDAEEYQPSKPSYNYKPSGDYERIKDLSDQQAKEINEKTPKNCKTVEKDKMTCRICNDPKSGAKSQSCSYSSTPDAKKYAYVREKNYNSKDDPSKNDEEDGDSDDDEAESEEVTSKPKSVPHPHNNAQPKRKGGRSTSTPTNAKRYKSQQLRQQPQQHHQQQRPINKKKSETYLRGSESRPQRDVVGLDPFLYGGGADDDENEKSANQKEGGKSFEQYYSHVFPEKKNADYKDGQYEFVPGYDTKSDVDTVLAEFKKKDWSDCKRVDKEKLTCYQCKDKNGVNYEECMYISDSDPKSSRLVYEEKKRYYENGKPEKDSSVNDDEDDDDDNHSERLTDDLSRPYSKSEEFSDYDDEVTTQKSIKENKKRNNGKRVVIKKRKMKKNNNNNSSLKPEEYENNSGSEKRTIKRTVSYKIEGNDDQNPSRSLRYEHRVSHSSN